MFASKINLIHVIPIILKKLTPSLTWKVQTSDKKLYLTFDDGPHPQITPWVLDQLDKYGAKATFFCVGDNVRKYPDTYAEILKRGHKTGNHTQNHLSGWRNKTSTYLANVEEAAEYIRSDLFRPPYGQIGLSQIAPLSKLYQIVMWDVLTRDYEKGLNTAKALQQSISLTREGSIAVFHDSMKAEKNLKELLPAYMAYFHQKGFTFETL